ncbi:MAG TPA: CRISPR-associated endonuclease Cas2 [Polyangia bacterium]|nr:CRISPR-associated endonuclease Cas2 [Polyangia bacterium]
MLVLVCYDVSTVTAEGRRRLRRVADLCENHGVRVQFSLFECPIDQMTWLRLRHDLLQTMESDEDSLRFYFIDEDAKQKTEHHGVRKPLDLRGPLVF